MGYLTPRPRHIGKIKIIDPKPVWQVTIQREGKSPTTLYMSAEKAEPYFKAGHTVKLITTAGELKQYD